MKRHLAIAFTVVLWTAFCGSATSNAAPAGTAFTYQGLVKLDGNPISEPCDFQFRLYGSSTGPDQIGQQVSKSSVDVNEGLFTVTLDFQDSAFGGDARWLEIDVRCPVDSGDYTTLSPRQELTPGPYALYAEDANEAQNATQFGGDPPGSYVRQNEPESISTIMIQDDAVYGDKILDGAITSSKLAADSVGSGAIQSNAVDTSELAGNAVTTVEIMDGTITSADIASGTITAVEIATGTITSLELADNSVGGNEIKTGAVGNSELASNAVTTNKLDDHSVTGDKTFVPLTVTGVRSGSHIIRGENTSSGAGSASLHGWASSSSGATYGVVGETDGSTGSIGVHGYATHSTGNVTGVYGQANDSAGRGVKGTGFYGVYGSSAGVEGRGVFGENTRTTGEAYGVYGSTLSTSGTGVSGLASNLSGTTYGVFGQSNSTVGSGVYGFAHAGTGTNYGVYGITNSADGYGVYSDGDCHVNGTLTKSSGWFKIDHPLDPANMYLYHSFVESPDMMNIYNGNVVTDDNGEAWVELPEYFAALNQDFRYQLTVIGEFAQAIVARKIEDNRFLVRTDKPFIEVSWQVTGTRKDPWAEAHPIVVEEEKPPNERGKYLHPELHGKPEALRVSGPSEFDVTSAEQPAE